MVEKLTWTQDQMFPDAFSHTRLTSEEVLVNISHAFWFSHGQENLGLAFPLSGRSRCRTHHAVSVWRNVVDIVVDSASRVHLGILRK